MAQFPILSRQVSLSGKVRMNVGGNIEEIDLTTSSDVWSFASESNGTASSGSLAVHLATELATHSDVTSATAAYSVSEARRQPQYQVTLSTGLTGAVLLYSAGSPAIDALDIGLDGTLTTSIVAGEALLQNDVHFKGMWAPAYELSRQLRPRRFIYESAESPFNESADDFFYYGTQQDLVLAWEAVDVADIYAYLAADSGYAALADREAVDPNCLLETELEKLCEGTTYRLYLAHGEYLTVRARAGGRISGTEDVVTDNPNDPRRPTVTLPLKVVSS